MLDTRLNARDGYHPPCKFTAIANMLEEVQKPKCAAYMRKFKDENLVKGFALAILSSAKPERMETLAWQLEEIGAL
jgi:hypothetical protein